METNDVTSCSHSSVPLTNDSVPLLIQDRAAGLPCRVPNSSRPPSLLWPVLESGRSLCGPSAVSVCRQLLTDPLKLRRLQPDTQGPLSSSVLWHVLSVQVRLRHIYSLNFRDIFSLIKLALLFILVKRQFKVLQSAVKGSPDSVPEL